MTEEDVIARWQSRRDEWHRFRTLVDGTALCDEVLQDLQAVVAADGNAELTLSEAAGLSGYSHEHLGRLVREGKIPNAGKPGAPRIRRADVPRQPASALASSRSRTYDPSADARKLLSRQRGGSNDLS